MRIGQRSAIVFASKFISTFLGFVATLYFARLLGAEVLGVYAAVLAVVSWLKIVARLGVGVAVRKRISEGVDEDEYFTAGSMVIGSVFVLLSILVVVGNQYFESYISEFSGYIDVSIMWFLVPLLLIQLGLSIASNVLQGQNLVHINGLLQPVKRGSRGLIQILLVFLGAELLGMFVGFAVGGLIVILLSLRYVSTRPSRPKKRHFKSLFDYAKFSWFGTIKSRTFSNADILILQALVASSLVGVYSVAWGIATFFNLFGGAINQVLFPEVSSISAEEGKETAIGIVEDSLAYAGFIIIPGIVGGTILGDRILRIYGPEFEQGHAILVVLIVSILFHNYMRHFTNAMNALDRPDLPFQINLVFVSANIILNVVLVYLFGWLGAAVASAMSTALGLALAYLLLQRIVSIEVPIREIGYQVLASLGMGVLVLGLLWLATLLGDPLPNVVTVLSLVSAGAASYVVGMYVLSQPFRATIQDNLSGMRH